jgi:hypothetical protein
MRIGDIYSSAGELLISGINMDAYPLGVPDGLECDDGRPLKEAADHSSVWFQLDEDKTEFAMRDMARIFDELAEEDPFMTYVWSDVLQSFVEIGENRLVS